MRYAIERYIPGQPNIPMLYLTATAFSRDTETSDFLLLVSYVAPNAKRNGILPSIHLSDDSGSGSELARDIIEYLTFDNRNVLAKIDCDHITAYCHDIVSAYHDPELQHAASVLYLH